MRKSTPLPTFTLLSLPLHILLAFFTILSCHPTYSHDLAEPTFYSSERGLVDVGHQVLCDRPRPRPVRRGDVPPLLHGVDYSAESKQSKTSTSAAATTTPTSPLRYLDYGPNGHPYEQVRRLRQRQRQLTEERQLRRQILLNATDASYEEDEAYSTGTSHEMWDDERYNEEISRILQGEGLFQPLRIHFDTTELDQWAHQSTLTSRRIQYLTSQVLPQMAKIWSRALRVVPIRGSWKVDYNFCPFGDPIRSPSFSNEGVKDADLVIYVTANSDVCGVGTNVGSRDVLASAYSCFWDQFERPIAGTIDFCLDQIDIATESPLMEQVASVSASQGSSSASSYSSASGFSPSVQASSAASIDDNNDSSEKDPTTDKNLKLAIATAVHEIGHVLGVTSGDMLFFYNSQTGQPRTPTPEEKEVTCITGEKKMLWMPGEGTLMERKSKRGVRYFEVTLPTVKQVVRNHFNCQRLTGAPLENQPTNEDCFGSHFDERYFFTESLSAVLGGVPEMLSSLTLGLLHDSGWYRPNYSVAEISPFGHGAGCEFVEEPCIDEGELPKYSNGFFCNEEYRFENGKFMGGFGCDPTHTSIGICDLVDYSQLSAAYNPPPVEFQYYPGRQTLGALMDRTDYCPTYSIDTISCQQVSDLRQQQRLPQLEYFATAAESTSDSSRCFNTNHASPICLETECDEKNYLLVVKVAGREMACYFDGQKYLIPGTNVTFDCPKISVVCPNLVCPANCAGHGICDYTPTDPVCKCFDSTDTTPGCFNSFKSIPPLNSWNDNVRTSGQSASSSLMAGGTLWLFLSFLTFWTMR